MFLDNSHSNFIYISLGIIRFIFFLFSRYFFDRLVPIIFKIIVEHNQKRDNGLQLTTTLLKVE